MSTPANTSNEGREEAVGHQGTLATSRHLAFSPSSVWAALVTPHRLARWWGPEGFTNEFSLCDMRPGGRWVFDMVGPDGKRYPNESVFKTLEEPHRWVVRHVVAPLFELTVELHPVNDGGTRLLWTQCFDDARVAAAVRALVGPANEQNIDRLNRELQAG